MKSKKILLSTIIIATSYLYGDIQHIKPTEIIAIPKATSPKLELDYKLHKSINVLYPSNVVHDRGETDNLSNYILNNISNGKLSIKKDMKLNLCGENTYIISIGINNYTQMTQLSYAVSDAKIIPLRIERSCPNVKTTLLLDATEKDIVANIKNISKKVKKRDTFILFFSGFGIKNKNKNLIAPSDIEPKVSLPNDTLSLEAISKMMSHEGVEIFLLLDTYFFTIPPKR